MRRFLVFIAALFSAAAAHAADPVARLPYRTDFGAWYTVSATIDGKGPYEFIIDSGTSHTLLFESAAVEVGATPAGGVQTVYSIGASGQYERRRLGDVAVGGARLDNAMGVVLADWPVGDRMPAGILGLDFLSRYIVVFDAGRREVAFYAREDRPDFSRWPATPLNRKKFAGGVDLFTIDAVVDNRRVEFLFDIGAAGTVVNDHALEVILRAKKRSIFDPTPQIMARIAGALDDVQKIKVLEIDRMQAGDNIWRKRLVAVYNAPMFEALGREKLPFGLFGADLLKDRSFAMDFVGGELRVGPEGGLTAGVGAPQRSFVIGGVQ
jgi:predicted aspartyl protease